MRWSLAMLALLAGCAPEFSDGELAPVDGGARRDTGVVPPSDRGTPTDTGVRTDAGVPSGDTTPPTGTRENCATPFDDNGDGQANEGCACAPGTTGMCFERTEPQFRGMCRMGTQRCMGSGEFGTWGPCERSWLPLPSHGNQCEVTQSIMDMTATRAPVDILWFLDTSGSMAQETMYVNDNLNRFATTMAASGLDYRVVMVARRGTALLQVCVPTPLGGAGCTDGPRFRHIDQYVSSNDGLQQVVNTYPRWRDFFRPDSIKVFIAVTDDESRPMTADTFDRTVRTWPGFTSYVFNSIVGYESRTDCPSLAARGTQYLTLTMRTMGDQARVCDRDWSSIFTTFARGIARRANSWVLGEPARADTVQVWIVQADGRRTQLPMGWSYDPTTNRVTVDSALLPAPPARVEIVYRPRAASP